MCGVQMLPTYPAPLSRRTHSSDSSMSRQPSSMPGSKWLWMSMRPGGSVSAAGRSGGMAGEYRPRHRTRDSLRNSPPPGHLVDLDAQEVEPQHLKRALRGAIADRFAVAAQIQAERVGRDFFLRCP